MGKGIGNIIICIILLAGIRAGAFDIRWFAAFMWDTGTTTVNAADSFVKGNNNRDGYPYNPLGNLSGD